MIEELKNIIPAGSGCRVCGNPVGDHLFVCDDHFADFDAEAMKKEANESLKRSLDHRWQSICPQAYAETQPELLPERAKAIARTIDRWDQRKGLTIAGASGNGKTRIAVMALHKAFMSGSTVDIMQASEFRLKMWKSFDGASALYDRAINPDVLLIDDLGQGAPSPQADDLLLSIFEYRTSNKMPTIVTSQYRGQAILSRFITSELGEAIARRIGKDFAYVFNFGDKTNQPT